jgi:DNA-directed RNA polymerase subunit RPC12/RpoP
MKAFFLMLEDEDLPVRCIDCGKPATDSVAMKMETGTVGAVFVCERCKRELAEMAEEDRPVDVC